MQRLNHRLAHTRKHARPASTTSARSAMWPGCDPWRLQPHCSECILPVAFEGGGSANFYSGACVYVNEHESRAQPPQSGCSAVVTRCLRAPVPANGFGLVFTNASTPRGLTERSDIVRPAARAILHTAGAAERSACASALCHRHGRRAVGVGNVCMHSE